MHRQTKLSAVATLVVALFAVLSALAFMLAISAIPGFLAHLLGASDMISFVLFILMALAVSGIVARFIFREVMTFGV